MSNMNGTMQKIAAGLEAAFARRGFAEPSVDDLREAAGVSLRTLYKYAPSREAMVRKALEHRHQRYIAKLFDDLPAPADRALDAILERIAAWMRDEASHGCLFHGAVASAPGDGELRALLERHKTEIAERTATAARLTGREAEISFILEGLAQSWPLQGELALKTARTLLGTLKEKQLSLAV
jgi:AcrR family transcriptional regulator